MLLSRIILLSLAVQPEHVCALTRSFAVTLARSIPLRAYLRSGQCSRQKNGSPTTRVVTIVPTLAINVAYYCCQPSLYIRYELF
ncbi:hypothetical protein GGR53DRAFT_486108 [Hypoxylon sp. FL1150]|nr:hypothetical protein GGR53DRAFT_486108 [Hypoxylon sp. FL1150]